MNRELLYGSAVMVRGKFPGNKKMSWREGTVREQTGDLTDGTYIVQINTHHYIQQHSQFIMPDKKNRKN